jgi:hypothetical protein
MRIGELTKRFSHLRMPLFPASLNLSLFVAAQNSAQ